MPGLKGDYGNADRNPIRRRFRPSDVILRGRGPQDSYDRLQILGDGILGMGQGLYTPSTQARNPCMFVKQPGWYWAPVGGSSVTTSAGLTNGTLRIFPFFVPVRLPLAAVGAEITSAGDAASTYRIGVWSVDGSTDLPNGPPLIEGTIAGDSVAVQEFVSTAILPPGVYWAGGVVQGVTVTQPTVRIVSVEASWGGFPAQPGAGAVAYGLSVTGVTGALPTLSSSSTFAANGAAIARIFFKFA